MENLLNFKIFDKSRFVTRNIPISKNHSITSHFKQGEFSEIDIFKLGNNNTVKEIKRNNGFSYSTTKNPSGEIVGLNRITPEGTEQKFTNKKWIDLRGRYN